MAVQVVLSELEKRLPEPLAAQLSSHLGAGGGSCARGGLADLGKSLRRAFGK